MRRVQHSMLKRRELCFLVWIVPSSQGHHLEAPLQNRLICYWKARGVWVHGVLQHDILLQ